MSSEREGKPSGSRDPVKRSLFFPLPLKECVITLCLSQDHYFTRSQPQQGSASLSIYYVELLVGTSPPSLQDTIMISFLELFFFQMLFSKS